MGIAKCDGINGMKKTLKHEYSDGVENKTIAILGNYPPPLGGVSVHIKRVMHKFIRQDNRVHHFDTLKRHSIGVYVLRLILFLCAKKPDIVYYHTIDLNSRLIEFRLLILLKKLIQFKLMVVEHNCRHLYDRSNEYKKEFNNLMRSVDHLVLIGYATEKSYQENHIIMPESIAIEAAFLPPDTREEDAILSTYPEQLKSFIESHLFIITVNAFQLSLLEQKDLYGIDQCIELLQKLNDKRAGLIIVLGSIGDINHYSQLKERIKLYALEDRCLWIVGQKELWPVLKRSHIFVRPTLSDAESVSVQEALYFNVPVIASDACLRPEQVLTFKTGNVEDFYAKINHMRNHLHA